MNAPTTAGTSATDPVGAAQADVERFRLLVDVPDRSGFVSLVSGFLAERGANILELDSHVVATDVEERFYMRVEFGAAPGSLSQPELSTGFEPLVDRIDGICWEIWPVMNRKRVCLLVSRYDHCLVDVLTRWRSGELPCDIQLVVSNHRDLAGTVESFGVEYRHIPVDRSSKSAAEEELLGLLEGRFELVVLARYMQILSAELLAEIQIPMINIHHSFLPAFSGADPYARARDRGVKILGATAHYVTEELDGGPIIEQDVGRISHRDSVVAMTRAGRDIERTVLARALRWHLEDRVAVHGNSTVVFA